MRHKLFVLLSALSASVYAAGQPPVAQPASATAQTERRIEEAPQEGEPEVTIIKKTEQTVEEYRVGGRLYMIKITPRIGKPYYLVDDLGDGKFSRQEGLDSGVRPPRWVLKRF